jgi:26S proteasome regulatory subunit N2
MPPILPLAARCLDQYFDSRRRQVEGGEESAEVDPRLVAVVERMVETACQAGQWEQAVGVALEARRLDILEAVVGRCPDKVRRQLRSRERGADCRG